MILFIEHMEHILKDTFKNYNTLHSYDEKHVIIKTQIKDLINVPLCNWEYNRPPDILRCNEISEYIQMYKKPFDYIIFITYNSRKSLYEVYDGIHRLTAIMNLYKKLNEENNVEFKKWLLNQYVFLNIRFNASDGEIVDIFKVINKSNPIPDLYIKDNNKLKRDIIENVTSEWTKKYKTHFSANKKPNKPNIVHNLLKKSCMMQITLFLIIFQKKYRIIRLKNAERVGYIYFYIALKKLFQLFN